ncbi:hypothetical protein ACFZAV_36770 [Streptomyces sp. NPDC008343]
MIRDNAAAWLALCNRTIVRGPVSRHDEEAASGEDRGHAKVTSA